MQAVESLDEMQALTSYAIAKDTISIYITDDSKL
jgi:hypothetical protein